MKTVWETKFLEHSPKNRMRCSLCRGYPAKRALSLRMAGRALFAGYLRYVLYIIPFAQTNFLLSQLKMHSYLQAGEH